MLRDITPVILTLNEEANLERTLEPLTWADDIVVVDSGSADGTCDIARRYPQVRLFSREFTTHAEQWQFAVFDTEIATHWVLALDADYLLSEELMREIGSLRLDGPERGFSAAFRYCINGTPLKGTVYPPVTVLFDRNQANYVQDGHTQRIELQGPVGRLQGHILHDDRKPLASWLQAQDRYMELEAAKLHASDYRDLNSADKLRKTGVLAPFFMFWYVLLGKGVILDGYAGLAYAWQRTIAEGILAVKLFGRRLPRPGIDEDSAP